VIVESLAINLHLAQRYGGPLSPKDAAENGRMTMWGFWAANELEPHAVQALYNRVFYPPENRSERDVTTALAALEAPMAVLDAALAAGGGYLVGKRFTVADLNMASVLFYLRVVPEFLAKFPNAKAMYEAAMARPAAQRAFAMRGSG
jgi:glutathione S-transferase